MLVKCTSQIVLIRLLSDGAVEFHFNLCEEVEHLIVSEYHKPLQFLDIPNQMFAEQLTHRDAVSDCVQKITIKFEESLASLATQ